MLFGLCCFFNTSNADVLDVKLSRDKIALGETVTVSFYINNTRVNSSPDFSPLEKDFRILGTNYGSAINVVNGVTQTQTFWQVALEPKSTGELSIPEIKFGDIKSPLQKIFVEENSSVKEPVNKNADAFAQAKVSSTSPYVQSQVLYTFKLFYRSQLENSRLESPKIKDGLIAQVGEDKFYQTTIQGEQYFVFERNFAIFPQKVGKFIIPPIHFRASQLDVDPNWMNDPFSATTNKLVNLATPKFTLDVQKTPADYKGKVWLPAKKITLTENWSAELNKWETGNPITRTITIQAEGLRADQIPDVTVDKIANVNIYADPPHRSNSVHADSVIGTLQQKITYIPNQPQSFTFPALKLNWWNTITNKNALAELKSINIQVQGKVNNTSNDSNQPIPKVFSEQVATESTKQSQLTRVQAAKIATQTTPFYLSIWFWLSSFLLIMWLITLSWIWKNRSAKITKLNPDSAKNLVDRNHVQFDAIAFAQACKQGDMVSAQKHLLLWFKKEWKDPPQNLSKLREIITDEAFITAVDQLEQALYANKNIQWDGITLLDAFRQVQKENLSKTGFIYKNKKNNKINTQDPLPPLNP